MLWLVGIACDPSVGVPKDHPKAATKVDDAKETKTASKLEETKTNVSGDRAGLSACLDGCSADAKLSETDRATCRLNCESANKVAPTPAADGGLEQAATCMGRCYDAPGEPKACLEGCEAAIAGVVGAPSKETLDRLGPCIGDCHKDKTLKPTDRETCRLTCVQVASVEGPGQPK